ncbi:tyrosine-type recombinase/integrase [Streptomyces sp. NPDC088745]|uniref:tyrosine-type recombinase/integrase n=1 Tax=Streptomyces sp. NPDC088745 TaxID=3365884 RepID=UPI00380A81F9
MLARDLWEEKGYVFTSPIGEPLNPNTDFHRWKDLLKAAGVRDGRLHDARHTAATTLLILGVPDTVVDRIMGWEPGKSARMRRRYQHVTGQVLQRTAAQVGGLLWGPEPTPHVVNLKPRGSATPSSGDAQPGPTVYVARLGERLVPFQHQEHAEAMADQWAADHRDQQARVEEWDPEKWEHKGPGGLRALRDAIPDRRTVHHAHAVFMPGGEPLNIGRDGQWSVTTWEFEADLYTDLPVRWHTTRRSGQEVEAQVRRTDQEAVTAAFDEARTQAVDRARNPGRYGDLGTC